MGQDDQKTTGLDAAALFGPQDEAPHPAPKQAAAGRAPGVAAPSLPRIPAVATESLGRAPAVAGPAGTPKAQPAPADSAPEPRPLADIVGLLAGPEPLPPMDTATRARLRLGSAALLQGGPLSLERLGATEDAEQLAAAVSALQIRADLIFAFWKPLLALSREARTSAPVGDLEALRAEARAVLVAVARLPDPESAHRLDAAARAIVERASGALPSEEARAAVRAESQARMAAVAPKPNRRTKEAGPKEGTGNAAVLGGVLVLLLVVGAALRLGNAPQQEGMDLGDVQAVLPEARTARFYGQTLEIEVESAWRGRTRGIREDQVRALFDIADRPPFERVGLRDRHGWILSIEPGGRVNWLDPSGEP
jgi:hypothetical protein